MMHELHDATGRGVFVFGDTRIQILRGDLLRPGVPVDVMVSTDDNYLTMGSGVARALAEKAGPHYVRAVQKQSPVKAGTVVTTRVDRLPKPGLDVKYVLHGTVIDYDTSDSSLEELVYRTTAKCLAEADALRVKSIVFPALAAGSGGLPLSRCAHQMCSAIKAFLAQERRIESIYVMLHVPLLENGAPDPAELASRESKHRPFFEEASLVLGTPYNPASGVRQTQSFYGREAELGTLQAIISAPPEDDRGKRHAVILGGPSIGKRALLDQLFCWSRDPSSGIRKGQCVAQLTIGRVHRNTPKSFIYRRFLSALAELERDKRLLQEIADARANPDLDCEGFLRFLDGHADRYQEVVFLVDRLPRLLDMDRDKDVQELAGVRAFWTDLDDLQRRVRFIYTAREQEYRTLFRERLDPLTQTFKHRIQEIRLACLPERERDAWVDALFQRYLGRTNGVRSAVHRFFEQEAGLHPYLISLVGYAVVAAIKRSEITDPGSCPVEATLGDDLPRFLYQAIQDIEGHRQRFFDELLAGCDAGEQFALKTLAEAKAREREQLLLLGESDAQSVARLRELTETGSRSFLALDTLARLQDRGILVHAQDKESADFMAGSFGDYVARFFGVGASQSHSGQPRTVTITLIRPEPDAIMSLFRGTGATTAQALKKLPEQREYKFLADLGESVRHWRDPTKYPGPAPYRNPEAAGNYILTQFTTGAIKGFLQNLPDQSTISLAVDHALKDIPWELMLEPAYTGEIRFSFGRSVVGQESRRFAPPVRGNGTVKALLIGDPTDNIPQARAEIEVLARRLRRDRRFQPEVRLGSEGCTAAELLVEMGSGQYGLIHYSGHSVYDGSQSAWLLAGGETIATDELTSALQMQPPALVISSSCESARAGEPGPARYEFQTFDLASAFLEAGVEAYVGTLWEVQSGPASEFTRAFYTAFLSGECGLGECVRRGKWACKRNEISSQISGGSTILINWLAFVLYGDPHARPGDLFPVMQRSG